jgi:hypothetical protein
LAALDAAAAAGGAKSAVVGHWATTGGCGEAMGASAAVELAGAGRGEDIRVGGVTEAEGARAFPPANASHEMGIGFSVCPFNPHKYRSWGARMAAPPNLFVGCYAHFFANPQTDD